ncbi:MAG: hypothetical protein JWR37_3636 [Mycobacterium sp.]|jgi:hypothetical protein|nr:hypothetical protein [Mycobacterium sp.]
MQLSSWLNPHGTPQRSEQSYWLVSSALLLVCAVALVVCVSHTNRGRPWDGPFIALSPALALTATINVDLFAVALATAGMMLWSR